MAVTADPRARRRLRNLQLRRLERTLVLAGRLDGYRDALVSLAENLAPEEKLSRLSILERRDIQSDPQAFRNSRRSPAAETRQL